MDSCCVLFGLLHRLLCTGTRRQNHRCFLKLSNMEAYKFHRSVVSYPEETHVWTVQGCSSPCFGVLITDFGFT